MLNEETEKEMIESGELPNKDDWYIWRKKELVDYDNKEN